MRLLANWHCPLKKAQIRVKDLLRGVMPHKDQKSRTGSLVSGSYQIRLAKM